jgi:hypothetical protein
VKTNLLPFGARGSRHGFLGSTRALSAIASIVCSMKILDVPQSGSVGARTSSRNRSGQYVRQRAMPTQPRTASQVAARSALSGQSAAWRGLTDAQRAAWNGFAQSFTVVNSLGSTINLTGHQAFCKINAVNIKNGDATVVVPPALPAFGACSATGADGTAATQLLELSGVTPTTGIKHMVYVSPQLSPGVSYNANFRYILTGTTYTAGKLALTTAYTAKFGALIAGKKVFVKVVQSALGFQDNGTVFTAIIGT